MNEKTKKRSMPAPDKWVLDDYFPYKMTVLSERASLLISGYYKSAGITVMKWRTMGLIGLNPGISPVAISQITYMGKSRVTRAVDSLVQDGWVVRQNNPRDNRAQMLELTKEGQAFYEKIVEKVLDLQFRLASSLTEQEHEHFKTALIKFDAVLNQMEAESQRNKN